MPKTPHHTAHARLTKPSSDGTPQLRMVPMIDVVFLLLVFFLLTANFRSREGFLPAELPRRVTHAGIAELEPVTVRLDSQPDGSCTVQIDTDPAFVISGNTDFSLLSQRLETVLKAGHRNENDPVKLMPTPRTEWDCVVKAYDALWSLDLRNILFAATP